MASDKIKDKKLIFRLSAPMYDFIREFAKMLRIRPSELMRTIVTEYFMAYYTENYKYTYKEMRDRFMSMFPESFETVHDKDDGKEDHSEDSVEK